MKIKLFNKISETGLEHLPSSYEISADIEQYDAILLRSASLHEVEFADDLKCIARAGAGVNNIPIEAASKKGIAVFNTPGANANAVKELVLTSLLLSSRKIIDGIEWVKKLEGGEIEKAVEQGKSAFIGPEIAGKKLGVIGLGAIGVQVANAASALGMDVYGFDPFISVKAAWTLKAKIHHAKDVKSIYEQCDYISIHIPFKEETKNYIDTEAFALMKKGVRLINLARGGLVEQQAVIDAINAGVVASYVTDFPSKELCTLDAVIPFPHLGASTPESEDNCALMAVKECYDYLEYGIIANAVNLPDFDNPQEAQYRICIINNNIPNVVGQITSVLASENINIENMFNKAKKEYAYTVVETNDRVDEQLLDKLRKLIGIIKVRLV